MTCSWRDLEALYPQAREGNPKAWVELATSMTERITCWIRCRDGIFLPHWELEEIAHAAFTVTALHFEDIPSWPQAWMYAKKAALRLALRRLRRFGGCLPLSSLDSDLPDPDSQRHVLEQDLAESWLSVLETLSLESLTVLSTLVNGDVTLSTTAKELRVSVRTLKRRRRALRKRLSRRVDAILKGED